MLLRTETFCITLNISYPAFHIGRPGFSNSSRLRLSLIIIIMDWLRLHASEAVAAAFVDISGLFFTEEARWILKLFPKNAISSSKVTFASFPDFSYHLLGSSCWCGSSHCCFFLCRKRSYFGERKDHSLSVTVNSIKYL